MRAIIVMTAVILGSTSATAQESEAIAWWATADFWRGTAPFFGAFLGFFGATFVNDWLHRRRDDRLDRKAARGVAIALRGQALAIAELYERTADILRTLADEWENDPPIDYEKGSEFDLLIKPEIPIHIYTENIGRLGILDDADIIADITQFFSIAKPSYASSYGEIGAVELHRFAMLNDVSCDRANHIAEKLRACADRLK